MNRKLPKRVVRWLSIFSTTALIGGTTFTSGMAQGQDPIGIGTKPAYQWQVDTPTVPTVQQAAVSEHTPASDGYVEHAGGSTLPPIVSPNQAIPKSNSSMLAPIEGNIEPTTTIESPIQDRQVELAATQDPNAPVLGPASNSMPPIIASHLMPPQDTNNSIPPIIASNSLPPYRANNSMPPIIASNSMNQAALPPTATMPSDSYPTRSSPPFYPTSVSNNGSTSPTQDYSQATPDYFQNNINATPGFNPAAPGACSVCGGSGCPSCQNSNSPGLGQAGCNSCGPGGCFNQQDVDSKFGCCGSMACASQYFIFDIFAVTRGDDTGFGGTNFGGLDDFDYSGGFKLTFGRRFDATSGSEFTIFGTDDITRDRETFSNSNSLNAAFRPSDGFGAAELSSFFGANRQFESQTTSLYSFEYNRIKWSWDVAKMFLSLRYIYTEDNYSLFSQDNNGQGLLNVKAHNNLIGPQIGGEMFYDVGYRLSFSFLGKAGFYVNVGDLETNLVNNGLVAIDNRTANNTDMSATVDFGLVAHYQLAPKFRFRAGFQGLWMFGAFSANGNYPRDLGISSGGQISNKDDMTFIGIFGGFEYYR